MPERNRVVCPENEALVEYMMKKRQEMAHDKTGLSENRDMWIQKAISNVCSFKTPIQTLKDFSEIKGVGKWTLKLMKAFFHNDSSAHQCENFLEKGKKSKRYVPQKNSAAYSLLISLYRGTRNGVNHMSKQELIDAAEASGLSRAPITIENSRGRHFGSSPRDWYSGWNGMKTLIDKGLVLKSNCPAKYKLSPSGHEAAIECLRKSNLLDAAQDSATREELPEFDIPGIEDSEFVSANSQDRMKSLNVDLTRKSISKNIPPECLERFIRMGYSKDDTLRAFREVSKTSNQEMSLLWPSVLCHLRENQVYSYHVEPEEIQRDSCGVSMSCTRADGDVNGLSSAMDCVGTSAFRSCTSYNSQVEKKRPYGATQDVLRMPPLKLGEKFNDVYEVILVLDNREHFASQGSKARKIIDNISSEFKIKIEVRRLPVGDGIWIARHKELDTEYVLDFIVERKRVDDLRCSIRDNRYRDQKLRLLRSGLRKLIYLVEGDPNRSEAADSIKTACLTTEVLEGFDVHRTNGLGGTLRTYGHLTRAIAQYYKSDLPEEKGICPRYSQFIRKCEDLDKMTVSDVFAVQLVQVPQVTEDVAIAVLDLYPTLLSLARAYSRLDGDTSAQEEMLCRQSNNKVSAVASKNIFQLVWGN